MQAILFSRRWQRGWPLSGIGVGFRSESEPPPCSRSFFSQQDFIEFFVQFKPPVGVLFLYHFAGYLFPRSDGLTITLRHSSTSRDAGVAATTGLRPYVVRFGLGWQAPLCATRSLLPLFELERSAKELQYCFGWPLDVAGVLFFPKTHPRHSQEHTISPLLRFALPDLTKGQ